MSDINEILSKIGSLKSTPCYPSRIETLRRKGMDTSIIEKGVEETLEALRRNVKSFVIYGEPQSGKTEVMIALTCRLIDEGYKTIFIVMNDNTELESQNYDRFQSCRELNPSPLRDFELRSHNEAQLKQDTCRIIFCRKNSANLEKLIVNTRHMKNRILIDDEADFATPDTRINKDSEASAINKKVGKLAGLDSGGVYIGVTATPGRLDLNNTYLNDSNEWIFLKSHSNYKGRSFFFPSNGEREYKLVLMPDDKDDPKYLRRSVMRFLLRTSYLNLDESQDIVPYSMLIHTAGKTLDHVEDKKNVDKVVSHLLDPAGVGQRMTEELINVAEGMFPNEEERLAVVGFLLRYIGKNQVLIINHKEDRANVLRASKPQVLYTFAIGGNIVSRGLTFENLLTFFFSRNVKGRLQQNTYIQRARMFGYRPYSDHFELCIPEGLYKNWAECFKDHELSLRLAQGGNLVHIQSSTNSAADSASIDKRNITIGRGEREVGDIFTFTDELEKVLLEPCFNPVQLLKRLVLDGLLSEAAFAEEILNYIEETGKPDASDVCFVLKESRGVVSIQNIEQYSDGDTRTITRKRGGIIQAIINRRTHYDDKIHYILPIMNEDRQGRFLYRSSIPKTVLQNARSA